MKKLSKERLEQIANDHRIDFGNINLDEVLQMARALLAGMAQEPVMTDGEIYALAEKHNLIIACSGDGDYNHTETADVVAFGRELLGLIPAPVVPEPVSQRYKLPDGIPDRIWLNTAGQWPEDGSEGEVIWCRDQQHELDTLYVRADCAEQRADGALDILMRTAPNMLAGESLKDPVGALCGARFVVCPDCGNKRCPKANDHRNACSGSNEPGQEGSAYPDAKEV